MSQLYSILHHPFLRMPRLRLLKLLGIEYPEDCLVVGVGGGEHRSIDLKMTPRRSWLGENLECSNNDSISCKLKGPLDSVWRLHPWIMETRPMWHSDVGYPSSLTQGEGSCQSKLAIPFNESETLSSIGMLYS